MLFENNLIFLYFLKYGTEVKTWLAFATSTCELQLLILMSPNFITGSYKKWKVDKHV